MKTRRYTAKQLRVLTAASSGQVHQSAFGARVWVLWPKPDPNIERPVGEAVTPTAHSLIRHGLARRSAEAVEGRYSLVVTADGYELLSKNAHHGR